MMHDMSILTRTIYTLSHLENDRDVSAHSEEDACHRARNLCVFSHVQKGT